MKMNAEKTVLYLRTDFSKEKLVAGGSVSHTLGVIEGFLFHGYKVIVASSIMLEQFEGLAISHLQPLRLSKSLLWLKWKVCCLVSNYFFLAQSYSLFKKSSIDYIYQRYSVLNCTGILLSRWFKAPLILEYNGSEVWLDLHWSKKKRIKMIWLLRFFEWINIRYADQIVVVSKPLEDELVQRGIKKSKILVNPNGVNTVRLDPQLLQKTRAAMRKQLGVEDSFVFGFIGTFSQWHGIAMLANMIPKILKQKPHAHFLLVGDGDLLPFFKEEVQYYCDQKKVTCTGLVPSREAKDYLSACDAFLSPTQPNIDGTPFFGSPTKLFEYLSMGKPIIASDLDQVAEVVFPALHSDDLKNKIVVDDELGIVLPPKDVEAFVQAACRLIDCAEAQRISMGFNARKKAVDHYDWKSHVERIMLFKEKQ